MAGITLAIAQQNLDDALAALADARKQQEYQLLSTTGGRKVTRGSHESLVKEVQFWDQKVKALSRGGGIRTFLAVPN
jgi:hypothetical protein